MIKKSKSWTHEPFKVSRLAFAHPVLLSRRVQIQKECRVEFISLSISKFAIALFDESLHDKSSDFAHLSCYYHKGKTYSIRPSL